MNCVCTRRSLLLGGAVILIVAPLAAYAVRRSGVFSGLGKSAVATASTYSSISIELNAPGPTTSARAGQWGSCRLKYRVQGSSAWRDAIDLPYDTGERNGVPTLPAQYRGALLLLNAGTAYEIQVVHDDGSDFVFTAATRPEVANLPVAKVIKVTDRSSLTTVTAGGTAAGYVVYEPAGGRRVTFDAQRMRDYCLQLDASGGPVRHIIFRNIRFAGALKHCVLLGSSEGGNRESIGDIIFDNCEFDQWGSPGLPGCGFAGNLQSGIYSASTALDNVTVQRCHFHDPAYGANTWYADEGTACTGTKHPEGTQCITFKKSVGGHVLRFNTFEAAPGVRFNDSMGETGNFSDAGFPGANCDIHGNIVRFANDDGMEIEGRSQNIRIWNNLFDECLHGVGLAPVYRGPVYIWGNVGRISRSGRGRARGQDFLKWRRTGGKPGDWSGGHVFVFNNTLLPRVDSDRRGFHQLYGEKEGESIRNWHVWNNIVDNDSPSSKPTVAFDDPDGTNNDIRNNLFARGWTAPRELTPPTGNQDARAIFAMNSWNAATGVGAFILARGSPGREQGIPVPGVFEGRPDCGAQQHWQTAGVGYGHLSMR